MSFVGSFLGKFVGVYLGPVGGGGAVAYVLSAEPGSFIFTGQAVGLLRSRALAAEAGAFLLTGQDVQYLRDYCLAADRALFTVTDQTVDLLYGRCLEVEAGSFNFTGQDVPLNYGRAIQADAGSFSLTGLQVSLIYDRCLETTAGAFGLNGQDVGLQVGRVLSAGHGEFYLTNYGAELLYGRCLTADRGVFNLTGNPTDLIYIFLNRYVLKAEPGNTVTFGQPVNLVYDFDYDGRPVAEDMSFQSTLRLRELPNPEFDLDVSPKRTLDATWTSFESVPLQRGAPVVLDTVSGLRQAYWRIWLWNTDGRTETWQVDAWIDGSEVSIHATSDVPSDHVPEVNASGALSFRSDGPGWYAKIRRESAVVGP